MTATLTIARRDAHGHYAGAVVIHDGDLVTNAEVARILGVSRQRAFTLDREPPPGYPEAVTRTDAGPLRLRAEVEAWAARPKSRGGRPRRVADPQSALGS